MTVAQLILRLQNLPSDLEVYVQDPNNRIADECAGVYQEMYFRREWDGGGICLDLKDGQEVAIVCQG